MNFITSSFFLDPDVLLNFSVRLSVGIKFVPFSFSFRYLGNRKTISLDRKPLVELIDRHNKGLLSWELFSDLVKKNHADRMGAPRTRSMIADRPKDEEYFYSNPQECMHINLEPWPSSSFSST